jgi:hypothetical protein
VELADRGTLFLDEVGDLSLVAQASCCAFSKIAVRAARRPEVDRSGLPPHLRYQPPLDQFVRDSRFREDLYYRVNAFSIRLPSLRERPVDIPVLANRFVARYCAANGLPLDAKVFSDEAVSRLLSYHWPGNIRELESTVSRAALSSPGRVIRDGDIEFLHAHADAVGTRSGLTVCGRTSRAGVDAGQGSPGAKDPRHLWEVLGTSSKRRPLARAKMVTRTPTCCGMCQLCTDVTPSVQRAPCAHTFCRQWIAGPGRYVAIGRSQCSHPRTLCACWLTLLVGSRFLAWGRTPSPPTAFRRPRRGGP